MESISLFGDYFKGMRKKQGLTLRQFCQQYRLDPGNLSKMERGLLPPPSSKEKLEEYAGYLKIERGTDEWYNFFDLAAACSGRIPVDLTSDEELLKKLPLIFRTLRGQRPSEDQLKELVKLLRR